jgi:hypothetical protein
MSGSAVLEDEQAAAINDISMTFSSQHSFNLKDEEMLTQR